MQLEVMLLGWKLWSKDSNGKRLFVVNHDSSFELAIKVGCKRKFMLKFFPKPPTHSQKCVSVKKWVSSILKREALWEF
jgi:hypothetical protein